MLEGGHFKLEYKSREEWPGLEGSIEPGKAKVRAWMRGGIRVFPRANLGIACAEGTDGKLSLRKVNMDLSVINHEEGHE